MSKELKDEHQIQEEGLAILSKLKEALAMKLRKRTAESLPRIQESGENTPAVES